MNTVLAVYLFYYHYIPKEDGLGWMSGGTTWGDIPIHMAIIESFIQGVNKNLQGILPIPQSPVYSGELLPVAFFPHIHRAMMILTGMRK